MDLPETWKAVIVDGQSLRLVEEGIYSVLPDVPHQHLYDGRAAVYDSVVGTKLYNRLMWGASIRDYWMFAKQAMISEADGMVLDAGCGTLLFSAQAYLECDRPILAFDQSLQMLRRARSRLMRLSGSLPERIFLLQADLSALPFRARSFETTLCMNVLHHVADAEILIKSLKQLLVDGGCLYLSSLVKSNRLIGDQYLNALHRRGDLVEPRTFVELQNLLANSFGQRLCWWMRGNMAFATAVNSTTEDIN